MFKIGDIRINSRVVAAPMAGVTDKAFRTILKMFGCELVFTEMISAQALVYGQQKTLDMCDVSGEEPPVGVQLFGSQPDTMARAARVAVEKGAALVDINMGCPAPKIVKNGEGAALMREPERAARIVEAVVRAVPVPVTVKMRSGWDQSSINCHRLAVLAEEAGARAVTVHPRTREQLYSGRAEWSLIRLVKESVSIPVVGNGDVITPQDAEEMLASTGCDAVMVGRGCLGNPFIFRNTATYLDTGCLGPPPSLKERLETARLHLELTCRYKGEFRGIPEMRKHLAWYIKGIPHAAEARVSINQARTKQELESILEKTAYANGIQETSREKY